MLGSMHRLIDKEWVYGYTEGKRQIMREKEIWNKGCEHNNHYMMFSIEPPTATEGRGGIFRVYNLEAFKGFRPPMSQLALVISGTTHAVS